MEAGLGKGQGCVLRRALKAVGDGMGNVSDNVAGEGVERQEEGGEVPHQYRGLPYAFLNISVGAASPQGRSGPHCPALSGVVEVTQRE